jgi:Tfp pilus assembly protein PilF
MNKAALLLCVTALVCLTAFRNPPGALRYIEMADNYVSAGENALALECYTKAISLEPENPEHYISRSFFLLKQKRFEEALQDLTTCIRLDSGKPGCYLSRGLVYSELKRAGEADADFTEACRLGSRDGCSFAGNR